MRRACWVLVGAMMASGQTGRQDAIARLNADLEALRFLPRLPAGRALPDWIAMTREEQEALRGEVATRHAEQDRIMRRYADDASRLFGETVMPWDLAYSLTSVLAGKALSNDAVAAVNGAMVEALDGAFECRRTPSDLRKSARFRAASEQVYQSLIRLEAGEWNARVVVACLVKAGNLIVNRGPLIRPITPDSR